MSKLIYLNHSPAPIDNDNDNNNIFEHPKYYYLIHQENKRNLHDEVPDHADKRIFMYETNINRVLRNYCAFDSLHEFFHKWKKVPAFDNHFYEIIPEGKQKLHFDIDIDQENFQSVFSLDFAENAKNLLIREIINFLSSHNVSFILQNDLLLFSSHGPTKFSYHVIIDNFVMTSSIHCKEASNEIIDLSLKELSKLYALTEDQAGRIYDKSVNSKNQAFRMWKATKIHKNRFKEFCKEWNYFGQTIQWVPRDDDPRWKIAKETNNVELETFLILEHSLISYSSNDIHCELPVIDQPLAGLPLTAIRPGENETCGQTLILDLSSGTLIPNGGKSPSNISKETLIELVNLLKAERASSYEEWRNGVWAIKTVSQDYYDVAQHFSKKTLRNNYNEASLRKIWEDGNDNIKVGSLLYWLREDVDSGTYRIFLSRHGLGHKDYEQTWNENYYFHDFLRECQGRLFETEKTAKIYIKERLLKCLRLVNARDRLVVFKQLISKEENIREHVEISWLKINAFSQKYNGKKVGGLYYFKTKNTKGETCIQQANLFQLAWSDKSFVVNNMDFRPYAINEQNPLKYPNCLNTFTGFRTKGADCSKCQKGEKDCPQIQHFLIHIYKIWAKRQEELFQCIIFWFASLIQFPAEKLPSLNIIGEQGAGKGIIGDFIRDYLLGMEHCFESGSIESVFNHFNLHLANKLFVYISEIEGGGGPGISWKTHHKIKSMITDKVMPIEQKGADIRMHESHLHFMISSNNRSPFRIDGEKERRTIIFEMSDEEAGESPYFIELGKNLKQENADHLFSYLMMIKIPEGFFMSYKNIPKTDLRQDLINLSRPNPVEFIENFIKGEFSPFTKLTHTEIKIEEYEIHIPKERIYSWYSYWAHEKGYKIQGDRWFWRDISKYVTLSRPNINNSRVCCCKFDKILIEKVLA